MEFNFDKKFKQFIKFIDRNGMIMADIYNVKSENNIGYVRIVPMDYGITKLPVFEKYCRIIGLKLEHSFHDDITRINGYQQYHDCELTDDGSFSINKAIIEEL